MQRSKMTAKEKEVQCNVHGLITVDFDKPHFQFNYKFNYLNIQLSPFAVEVINSSIYKRLKGLKQLGKKDG